MVSPTTLPTVRTRGIARLQTLYRKKYPAERKDEMSSGWLRRALGVGRISKRIALRVNLPSQILENFVRHLQKYFHYLRVELPSRPGLYLFARRSQSPRRPVRTIGDDGVQSIRDRKYPRPQRNFVPLQPPRIARPIEMFLVRINNLANFRQEGNPRSIW